jgi:hypothetical protein
MLFLNLGRRGKKSLKKQDSYGWGPFLQPTVYAFCMENGCLRGSVQFRTGILRDYYGVRQQVGNDSATILQQHRYISATNLQQTCNNSAIKQQAFGKHFNRQLPCIHNASALLLPDP